MSRKWLSRVGGAFPLTFILVAVFLLVVTAAACIIPARRAIQVDPITALRYE